MHSIEKLFSIVDRKIDAFDFAIKKVKGRVTGNEYYAVSVSYIVNGEEFAKRVLTIGCPKEAIEKIVRAITSGSICAQPASEEVAVTLRRVSDIFNSTEEETPSEEIIPGLRRITPDPIEEVDEDNYENGDDDRDDDDDRIDYYEDEQHCFFCDEPLSECRCEEGEDHEEEDYSPRITLTLSKESAEVETQPVAPVIPLVTPTTLGPKNCPYCGAIVARNFAYCPNCGGQQ